MYIIGQHEDKTLEQLMDVDSRAVRTALMADGHFGYIMPIGGVAAYIDQVSVAGVGFDIGCGNCAILTDLYEDDLSHLDEIANMIQREIEFGIGRINRDLSKPDTDPLFDAAEWEAIPESYGKGRGREWLRTMARNQIGSVGSGNHYVDVFIDTYSRVWVGVHFGSRGLGHSIASGFMALDRGDAFGQRAQEHEALLSLGTPLGEAYWAMMNIAGTYAQVGRQWVARKVVRLLGGTEVDMVHNHHNFAWQERHFNTDLIVVRKGATPAFPNQHGFVGGSMGDQSVILRGATDSGAYEEQRRAMFSTVHGAGRVMGRIAAKGKVHRKTGRVIREGAVTQVMMDSWLKRTGVILRGGGRDESPHVYRRLPDVLKAQGNTIEVLETLTPIIVVMAD